MRRLTAVILALALLLSAAAFAETEQKAPDYILEGYDGNTSGRNWDTNLFFSRMQERTGISFQFRQYTDSNRWAERKQEIIQGEDLPDVLFKAELSPDETQGLYEAGVIIDLAPYLEEYAPNLWALLEEHPEWKKAITLPDGAIPALPSFNTLQNNDAMWINSAWLAKVKMEAPKTADELTAVLRAFKTGDPNGNFKQDEIPLGFTSMWELRFLGHAFGIIDNDYYVAVRDGKVTSSLVSDENRAFLAWLHGLWEEGLLDPNGFAITDSLRQITDENKDVPYGLLLSSTPATILPAGMAEQYTLLEPLQYEGKQVYRDLLGDVVRGTFAVTSACAAPEKLVAWADFLYTAEGSRLAAYGQENEEYIWNGDGRWEWNADLSTVANVTLPASTITEGGAVPGLADVDFQLKYYEDMTRRTMEQMYRLKQYSVLPYPLVWLKAEDSRRIAEIQDGLCRYAEKAMACFVTGDTELNDENWAEFCRTVEEKGLTEMIGIWQKYLEN